MIERHVTFNVFSDKATEFEKFFVEEYRPAMSSMAGFIKVELLRDHSEPTRYRMIIRFESIPTASAWRTSAVHQALKPKISSLYQDSSLQVFEVIA